MKSSRLLYKFSRYWRCYLLLVFASILSFILIYVSQKDPKLEGYFPYFAQASKYQDLYGSGGIEKIRDLMLANDLDYEFIHSNSRFCVSKIKEINEDLLKTGDEREGDESTVVSGGENSHEIDYLFLIISQVSNSRNRNAIRATWSKHLGKLKSKYLFVMGKPKLSGSKSSGDEDDQQQHQAHHGPETTIQDKEIKDFKDIVQINMPDNENFTSIKTLIAIRWALVYCSHAQNLFILSDSAVLNVKSFENFLNKNKTNSNATTTRPLVRSNSLVGQCTYKDDKLPIALRLFFSDLRKNLKNNRKNSKLTSTSAWMTTSGKANLQSSYEGNFCSDLGWLLSLNSAQRLWSAALATPYVMKQSAAFLNGYLAFKAGLEHVSLFEYLDQVPVKMNCLEMLQAKPELLMCAENFTIPSRYQGYVDSTLYKLLF